MRFIPLDDNVTSAVFELNNALNVSRVVDEQGKQIPASRSQQDFTVRLSFDAPLPKGKPVTVTFHYDGRLSGKEDSPVYGIKFAAIQNDLAYLMYPARWFPVNGYTTDRFGANLHVTVPDGILGARQRHRHRADGRRQERLQLQVRPARRFPAASRVVKGPPAKVQSEGVTTSLYFRGAEAAMAKPYGQETGKIMTLLHRRLRTAAVRQSDGGRDRRRRAERLRRAGPDLPDSARHRQAGEQQAAGQPDLPPMVGHAGFAGHPQSPVAEQRRGRLLRDAYGPSMPTAPARWKRSCATRRWKR